VENCVKWDWDFEWDTACPGDVTKIKSMDWALLRVIFVFRF